MARRWSGVCVSDFLAEATVVRKSKGMTTDFNVMKRRDHLPRSWRITAPGRLSGDAVRATLLFAGAGAVLAG
jgi:environmental stress-induced protein Ves